MPNAIDTVLVSAVNPGATAPANPGVSGDSLAVRAFTPASRAYLEAIIRQGATAGFVQVRSPLFHDPIQGIRITPGETPSVYSLPGEACQPLLPQDTLSVDISGGAAESDIAALALYYQDLPGVSARLHNWADISNNVKSVKPIRVAVTSSATIGAWSDTLITATENLLHANTDYAVLGYMASAALGVIALRGIDTGNLRVGGPGATSELATTDYFVQQSQRTGRPHIPVFNSANAGGVFVSVAASAASVASVVELICVELAANLPN